RGGGRQEQAARARGRDGVHRGSERLRAHSPRARCDGAQDIAGRASRDESLIPPMLNDLVAGSLVSFVNFGIHAAMTGLIVVATRHTAALTDHLGMFLRLTSLLTITMIALMAAHVTEIAVWAGYLNLAGITIRGAGPFEFAFENYTALGYGDVLPTGDRPLLGPIMALNGLLLIGWSVAVIFEVMRMAELQIGRDNDRNG